MGRQLLAQRPNQIQVSEIHRQTQIQCHSLKRSVLSEKRPVTFGIAFNVCNKTAATGPLLSRAISSDSVPISRFQSTPSTFLSSPKLSTISSHSRRSV